MERKASLGALATMTVRLATPQLIAQRVSAVLERRPDARTIALRAQPSWSDGTFNVKPYTFEDVARALNAVQPHDWAGFLRSRLDTHAAPAPLAGITRGGWSLSFNDQPSAIYLQRCRAYAGTPPSEDWDGVFTMTQK